MRVCSGCGLHDCDGRCFDECEADFADEETLSTLTLEQCQEIYDSPLTELLPENRFKWVA